MKKLLSLLVVTLGLTSFVLAQETDSSENQKATLELVSAKIDSFIESQENINIQMRDQINAVGNKNAPFIKFIEKFLPIMILLVISGAIVALVYILSMGSYRKNQLRYDSIMKCLERFGSVPDVFKNDITVQPTVSAKGRVHLILSILCCAAGTVFLICTIALLGNSTKLMTATSCGIVGFMFMIGSTVLFIQYNKMIRGECR